MGALLFHEAELGFLADFTAGAGGDVDGHDAELAEAGFEVAAFGVELFGAKAVDDAVGLFAAEEGDAAVAFAFGGIVEAVVAGGRRLVRVELLGVGAELLDADEVGVLLGEPGVEALADGGAEAVGVEGDDAHRGASVGWNRPRGLLFLSCFWPELGLTHKRNQGEEELAA